MFEAVEELLREHADLETKMSDPGVHANAGLARSLGRRYAQLTPIVETYQRWRAFGDDLEAARELGALSDHIGIGEQARQLLIALFNVGELVEHGREFRVAGLLL